jgi:hypothetical protein
MFCYRTVNHIMRLCIGMARVLGIFCCKWPVGFHMRNYLLHGTKTRTSVALIVDKFNRNRSKVAALFHWASTGTACACGLLFGCASLNTQPAQSAPRIDSGSPKLLASARMVVTLGHYCVALRTVNALHEAPRFLFIPVSLSPQRPLFREDGDEKNGKRTPRPPNTEACATTCLLPLFFLFPWLYLHNGRPFGCMRTRRMGSEHHVHGTPKPARPSCDVLRPPHSCPTHLYMKKELPTLHSTPFHFHRC